jgi:hypothetical protein
MQTIPEEDMVEYLQQQGFVVYKPPEVGNKIANEQIINLFYLKLYEVLKITVPYNDKQELQAIIRYQKKASKIGVTKYKANEHLSFLINYLFDNLEELNLTQVPNSIEFLLNAGSWMVKRILDIYSKKLSSYEDSIEVQLYKQRIYEYEDDKLETLRQERHKKLLKDNS